MTVVSFVVYGIAQPAGSKRAFVNRKTGRVQVTDAAKGSKPWQAEVRAAAAGAMMGLERDWPLWGMNGPLRLHIVIYVPRPKGHYGARGVRPSAPAYPAVRPDLTKLLRGIEDALTGVVWRDDAQVVEQTARKLYGEPARAEVVIETLGGEHGD